MGLFSRKTAERIDAVTIGAAETAEKIAGRRAGEATHAAATAIVGGWRNRIDVGCTCGKPNCPDPA